MAKTDARGQGQLLAEISNMVVRVYTEQLGRGPTRARSYRNEDLVTCILEDTLTRQERTLLAAGKGERVLETRTSVQEAMRETLGARMEALCGRRVVAIVGGTVLDPDVASQVFVLEGSGGE